MDVLELTNLIKDIVQEDLILDKDSPLIGDSSSIDSNSTILDKTFIARNINIGSASVVIGRKTKTGTIAPFYSKYLQF